MKELAKRMIQAKLPVIRQGSVAPAPKPAPEPQKNLPTHSVYRQHDSWTVRNRQDDFSPKEPEPEVKPIESPLLPPEAKPRTGAEKAEAAKKRRKSKLQPHKVRNTPVSVNMSLQEYELVREYVDQLDTSVSEWIRGLVFKAMGKTIPTRSRKKRTEE